jgi:hypothetical protein
MSTDRDTTRIVRSWLRTDENESADRVLGTVLDRLDATPQRRATWWPARRLPDMNATAKLALGAAAVVVVALLGINLLLPGGSNLGGPGSTADPTAVSPSVPASGPPRAPAGGSTIPAGTYVMAPFDGANDAIRFTVTVPDGWVSVPGHGGLTPAAPRGTEGPEGMGLVFIMVDGLYSDPCHGNAAGEHDVMVGPTVEDLAAALQEQSAYEASAPTDVALGGYTGLRMDLQLPDDIDFATCDEGQFWVWDYAPYAQGPGNQWHLWILDVEGTRVVVHAEDFATTPEEDRAEMQEIIDSIEIDVVDSPD